MFNDNNKVNYLANLNKPVDSLEGSGFVARQALRNAIHRVAKDVLREGLDDGAKLLTNHYSMFKDAIKNSRKPDPINVKGCQSPTVKHLAERAA